jgi:hypothetical protein
MIIELIFFNVHPEGFSKSAIKILTSDIIGIINFGFFSKPDLSRNICDLEDFWGVMNIHVNTLKIMMISLKRME